MLHNFVEGDDYQLVQQNLQLNPRQLQATIEIMILNDEFVLEGVKSITLELRATRGDVALYRPTTINIVDNDGK